VGGENNEFGLVVAEYSSDWMFLRDSAQDLGWRRCSVPSWGTIAGEEDTFSGGAFFWCRGCELRVPPMDR